MGTSTSFPEQKNAYPSVDFLYYRGTVNSYYSCLLFNKTKPAFGTQDIISQSEISTSFMRMSGPIKHA